MKAFGVVNDKKMRTSLRLPQPVLKKIADSLITNDYSLKYRSRWICEALDEFIQIDEYPDLIAEQFMDKGDNEVIPITLRHQAHQQLAVAAQGYVERFNTAVIDQSDILRAAIIHRLIHEAGGVVA